MNSELIALVDTETTGTDPKKDAVIEAVESACLACCARRPRAGLPPVLRAGGISMEENAMTDKAKQPWTPGPWTLGDENNSSCEVCMSVGDSVVVISLGRHDTLTGMECVIDREEMLANAHLVIAAPAMAEALALFIRVLDAGRGPRVDPLRMALDRDRCEKAARAALDLCGWQWGKP